MGAEMRQEKGFGLGRVRKIVFIRRKGQTRDHYSRPLFAARLDSADRSDVPPDPRPALETGNGAGGTTTGN